MKQIYIVFKKDLLETVRDRRTLVVMVVMPLLLFPMIFGITAKMQGDSSKTEQTRTLRVGFVGDTADFGLRATCNAMNMEVWEVTDTVTLRNWIRENRLELGVALENGYAQKIEQMQTAEVVKYGAVSNEIAHDRLDAILAIYQTRLTQARLDSFKLDLAAITPIKTRFANTELAKETIGKMVGGFLPYIFIIFCYMGCMFPAIDLFTGEKERGSIETLLSAPIERWKILVGKMLVIIMAGITTAILALTGMFLSLQLVTDLPKEILDIALSILTPQFILALIGMLLPMVVFFAGLMIPATVYAKSFKEASSILQPMNFLVIMPAVIGMMPGIELNIGTAFIPVLNIVLITKQLIAGTMDWGLYAIVIGSLLVLAAGAVTFSFRRFGNESNVLRT
jgi:sodium transport system permease protein